MAEALGAVRLVVPGADTPFPAMTDGQSEEVLIVP